MRRLASHQVTQKSHTPVSYGTRSPPSNAQGGALELVLKEVSGPKNRYQKLRTDINGPRSKNSSIHSSQHRPASKGSKLHSMSKSPECLNQEEPSGLGTRSPQPPSDHPDFNDIAPLDPGASSEAFEGSECVASAQELPRATSNKPNENAGPDPRNESASVQQQESVSSTPMLND